MLRERVGAVLASLLVIVIVGGVQSRAASQEKVNREASRTSTLDALEAEAQAFRGRSREQWARWEGQANELYEVYVAISSHWMSRGLNGSPPPPDFRPLNLPLAFIAAQLRQLLGAGDRESRLRWGYLIAVAEHPDPRRARFLEEYGKRHPETVSLDESGWKSVVLWAADAGWAAEKLRGLLAGDLTLDEDSFPFKLLELFAEKLPPDVVAAAYGYVYAQGHQRRIYFSDSEKHWELLLRLDRGRALSDIAALHKDKTPGIALLFLLIERTTGPDARMAQVAADWSSDLYGPEGQFKNFWLHILMLKAEPGEHLLHVVERLDKLVGVSEPGSDEPARPQEIMYMVEAMLKIEPSHITDAETRARHGNALAAYANRPTIHSYTRKQILDWLAKHRHPELPNVLARWMVEESDPVDRVGAILVRVEEWGEYGRESLKQAERINAEKTPKP